MDDSRKVSCAIDVGFNSRYQLSQRERKSTISQGYIYSANKPRHIWWWWSEFVNFDWVFDFGVF